MVSTLLDNPWVVSLAMTWTQVVPAALIVGGAGLLLWSVWRRPRAPRAEPVKPARGTEQVQGVMRDAEELASILAGRVDRQAERLEQLIAEADAKIRRLERLTADHAAITLREPKIDPINQRIYDLSDEGLAPVEIARQLSQQTGKVELILALRQR
jgi:hypothetical protein